jgi:hypothetical protein
LVPDDVIDTIVAGSRNERDLPGEDTGILIELDAEPEIRDLLEIDPPLESELDASERELVTELARSFCLELDVARKIDSNPGCCPWIAADPTNPRKDAGITALLAGASSNALSNSMYEMGTKRSHDAVKPLGEMNRPPFKQAIGASQLQYVVVWSLCSCDQTLFSRASTNPGPHTRMSMQQRSSVSASSRPRWTSRRTEIRSSPAASRRAFHWSESSSAETSLRSVSGATIGARFGVNSHAIRSECEFSSSSRPKMRSKSGDGEARSRLAARSLSTPRIRVTRCRHPT